MSPAEASVPFVLDSALARKILRDLLKRPWAYGLNGTYRELVVYVLGLDAGSRLLTGFREYLVLRADKGDNLHWPGLVWLAAFPGRPELSHPTGEVENHVAADALVRLLEGFLDVRDEPDGVAGILDAHAAWIARQPYTIRLQQRAE